MTKAEEALRALFDSSNTLVTTDLSESVLTRMTEPKPLIVGALKPVTFVAMADGFAGVEAVATGHTFYSFHHMLERPDVHGRHAAVLDTLARAGMLVGVAAIVEIPLADGLMTASYPIVLCPKLLPQLFKGYVFHEKDTFAQLG